MRQEEGDGSKKTEMIVRSRLNVVLNIQANTVEQQMLWWFAMIVTTLRGKYNLFNSTRKRQFQHCQV